MRISQALVTAVVAATCFGTLSGCGGDPGRQDTTPTNPAAAAAPNPSHTAGPGKDANAEAQPSSPASDPGDVPTNLPKPIPNPGLPPDPAKISVKAIATSAMSNPVSLVLGSGYARTDIHIDLAWSSVAQATQYQVAVSDDDTDNFVLKATLPAKTTKFRFGGGLLSNTVAIDRNYRFLIRALNSSGQVMAQGQDQTKPIYPLAIPKLVSPTNQQTGVTIQPQFQWGKVNGADGYYVEVFSGQYFIPTWRGYGATADRITMTYGDAGDQYPGSIPAMWTLVLSPGQRYYWSVTAFKTDTGNISTAKAYAESNAPFQVFVP